MAKTSSGKSDAGDPIIIKKYANRRLYNTGTSSYITLDHLAGMTRDGTDFKVVDAKSGADITRTVLTQIIMDEEAGGQTMLPTSFLREIISLYGNQMQAMVPSYLEASMSALRRNQAEFAKSMLGASNPFASLAQQNMKIFEAAFTGGKTKAAQPADSDPAPAPAKDSEVEELKAELAAMQAKLDRLG
ncbi:polyhydroxyalkanoate synthesis repressor PhaR [Pacificimonas sp. WHA3]|uniref:Polyhydroxyalkanoate synthesis repressor PhaR n=1 Tax=Pacificimonas pallii TaxID=2827236 RepID=A0ABS6SG20_9SPHN|nr:polyhydroxyalkanoate synthesis repressor PhaR [Pacificimonas pallii]MBV7257362.1 polyhydroxyalkanoate synthesis repressor PhaR [Pacificimonas pallii]